MTEDAEAEKPRAALSVGDAVALIVGVVIGAGIFELPWLVAANAGTESRILLVWLAGGVISFIGALCYAELATTYPSRGGEYHYLTRAFGSGLGFLFGWARMSVIQTGSIAVSALVLGNYAAQLWDLGAQSSVLYAALAVAVLTAVNITGLRQGKWTQNLLSGAIALGLLFVVAVGLFLARPGSAPAAADAAPETAIGLAMIFVLFTFGGWNEAAYVSAEVRDGRRNMARALFWGIGLITVIYLLVNLAYLRGLSLAGLATSQKAVAADLMRQAIGENGARLISLLIAIAALSTINATIITGARTNFALGRDFSLFRFLGNWRQQTNSPMNALLVQGVIALFLVLLGQRLETMVAYTAPVFWLFFLLVGVALFVLRRKEPDVDRPFRVPLYPLTPLLFCAVCVYMLRSTAAYAGIGALLGVGVLLVGVPLYLLARARESAEQRIP